MRKMIFLLMMASVLFSCTKDEAKIRYHVNCSECVVSYYGENQEFTGLVPVVGEWSVQFETEDPRIEVYAQSTLCSDGCDSASVSIDTLKVFVYQDGGQIAKSENCCKEHVIAGVILD